MGFDFASLAHTAPGPTPSVVSNHTHPPRRSARNDVRRGRAGETEMDGRLSGVVRRGEVESLCGIPVIKVDPQSAGHMPMFGYIRHRGLC